MSSEYLTYKEWKLFPPIVEIQKNKNVSTLPIRNGNVTSFIPNDFKIPGEYLTYKEWKHNIFYFLQS